MDADEQRSKEENLIEYRKQEQLIAEHRNNQQMMVEYPAAEMTQSTSGSKVDRQQAEYLAFVKMQADVARKEQAQKPQMANMGVINNMVQLQHSHGQAQTAQSMQNQFKFGNRNQNAFQNDNVSAMQAQPQRNQRSLPARRSLNPFQFDNLSATQPQRNQGSSVNLPPQMSLRQPQQMNLSNIGYQNFDTFNALPMMRTLSNVNLDGVLNAPNIPTQPQKPPPPYQGHHKSNYQAPATSPFK